MHVILSRSSHNVIGYEDGTLVCDHPIDKALFRTLTRGTPGPMTHPNVVVMGRKTWNSIPAEYRPLNNRLNVVVSRNHENVDKTGCDESNLVVVNSLFEIPFDDPTFHNQLVGTWYVIGGAEIYNACFKHPSVANRIKVIHETLFDSVVKYDGRKPVTIDFAKYVGGLFHPQKRTRLSSLNHLVKQESDTLVDGTYTVWTRTTRPLPSIESEMNTHPLTYYTTGGAYSLDAQYLDILSNCIQAPLRKTRNAATRSIFGMRILWKPRCTREIPLITTKKVAFKTCLSELLWFVSGSTDVSNLRNKGVRIWDANATRDFLDTRGLIHNEVDDIGPMYGHQWRHAGEPYKGTKVNYKGKGIDQLMNCERLLKEDPFSRRIVMSSWSVSEIDQMALPPCHVLCQWYVCSEGSLWIQVYQRSADVFLGLPFNLASYGILLTWMADRIGRKVGGYIHIIGDCHIYEEHLDAARMQLSRSCLYDAHVPRLELLPDKNAKFEDATLTDFKLIDYHPHSAIKAPLIA